MKGYALSEIWLKCKMRFNVLSLIGHYLHNSLIRFSNTRYPHFVNEIKWKGYFTMLTTNYNKHCIFKNPRSHFEINFSILQLSIGISFNNWFIFELTWFQTSINYKNINAYFLKLSQYINIIFFYSKNWINLFN